MIVIYGTRFYGEVEHCQGLYAATRFAHLYWMPLFPVNSTMWITAHEDAYYSGHRMRWSAKSIAAAYLRTWGLIAGLICLAAELVSGRVSWGLVLLGALLVGSALYTFRWRRISDAQRLRRDLFSSVTGTHCDPANLPDDMVISLRQSIEQVWGERFPTQTPNDIARFGAKEPAQAALAYSLFRLRAREVESARTQELLDLAETIAAGLPKETKIIDNPYRADAGLHETISRS